MSDTKSERVQKILSAGGAASRRESEKLISDGRVTVNGITAKLGDRAISGRDVIAVDGVPFVPKRELTYIMLNKPRGWVTTMRDEKGRRSVAHLAADVGVRVFPVGRLDMDSEGLLLMTNDGMFANAVMHPSHNITKTYEVHAHGNFYAAAECMRLPMEIDGRTVHAVSVSVKKHRAGNTSLIITIREGRNRQIRKMCARCGLTVESLKRVSVGKLKLGALGPGRWRYLTEAEVLLLLENNA